MHIQEIVVDGFKSYAHRTVIAGFDPHFNAITGLNGSGKSNILDSICFVLGITNLGHVRAGNLTELVYKQGQAGIQKATVTIVFNNEYESCSPVGYEQCPEVTVTRQVLVGGKSKYLISGRNSPASQVANFFHSVSLNVNNPHFLIMQGRITKVLNMKPYEILGMVEEAAGTRMYENKRVIAMNTIEKKQKKMEEINTVLSEEITPTLERLRNEKEHYLKWSKINADIERMEKFVIASDFSKAQDTLTMNKLYILSMENDILRFEEQSNSYQKEVSEIEDNVEAISDKVSGELGSIHKIAKSQEEKRSKELVKATAAWKNSQSALSTTDNDFQAAKDNFTETMAVIKAKNLEIQNDKDHIISYHKEAKESEEKFQRLATEYQNMCAGISSGGSDKDGMLPDMISKAHRDANNSDARAKQASMKFKHVEKMIQSVEKDIKKEEKSVRTITTRKSIISRNIQSLNSKLDSICFDRDEFHHLENEKVRIENDFISLQEKKDTLTAQLQGRLSFKYSDPVRGFDRSKVKGMVARLINVKNSDYATALEVVAGSRLYHVVVDEADTGKALLSRAKLQKRVTIIPLDKITPRRITESTVTSARSIAPHFGSVAKTAIELIEFDEEVRNAVEYVFGSTLVVDGMNAANKICSVTKIRTVTLDGDEYDPSGTISGGSSNNLGSTLSRLSDLDTLSSKLSELKIQLKELNFQLDTMTTVSNNHDALSAELELALTEFTSVEQHLSQTSFGMLCEKLKRMQTDMKISEKDVEAMMHEKENKWDRYKELKAKEIEMNKSREARLKEIDVKVKHAKVISAEKADRAHKANSHTQTLELEMDSLKIELAASEEALVVAEKAVQEAKLKEGELKCKVYEIKALYEEAKSALDDVEEKLSECSKDLKCLSADKGRIIKKSEHSLLEAKKLSLKVSKYQSDNINSKKTISSFLKKYNWIISERDNFGVPNGEYDFRESNPVQMALQLKSLQIEQITLAKKINKKVMGMIEKAEGEYAELLRKRKVVENDKRRIQAVIEELDIKKKSELEHTWKKVNRDFGSIFSTLLPDASSKLEPPEGMAAWEGLEVKVAFGNVWKQSLSELSGGQRSLLALSLILSLLVFKPAPMYILDEVDAALDLSHTQNIGDMLKTHFSQSQFIVVSLKEGMFNNANVIFRTKFVDGVSTVTRTIGVGASSKAKLRSDNQQGNPTSSNYTPSTKRRVYKKRTVDQGVGKSK